MTNIENKRLCGRTFFTLLFEAPLLDANKLLCWEERYLTEYRKLKALARIYEKNINHIQIDYGKK